MAIRTWLVVAVCALTTGLAFFPWDARAQVPDSVCRPTACGTKPAAKPAASTMTVASRRIKLNYAINDVGPSGVSSVELWATRDGSSWARYSNEPPPDGPLVVHVAEEGRYGFSIVVRNGVGVASPAPKTGDEPQAWVVVDETKPLVSLKDVGVGHGHDAGTLTVHWTASDERLAAKPVTISFAAKHDGPWTPIASAVENTGRFVWHMPREHPYSFYVRVEAADEAGNVGCDTTRDPIRIDHTRPKGTIVGVDAEKKTASLTVIPSAAVETPVAVKPDPSGFSRFTGLTR